jgi:hypothetical protein
MCTVTIVPYQHEADRAAASGRSVQLMANRDERRSRPPALPPRICTLGDRRALLPIDPVSQGTWIGVNDGGLAMTLLNVSPIPQRPQGCPRKSRGGVIPALLYCTTIPQALDAVTALDPREYSPFCLVLADRQSVATVRCQEGRIRRAAAKPLGEPVLFTSSGLGDQVVEGPRRQLFESYFSRPGRWPAHQEAFHRHSWRALPHLSVSMRRPDAQTVSCTRIELRPDWVVLTYHPGAPDRAAPRVTLSLELRRG